MGQASRSSSLAAIALLLASLLTFPGVATAQLGGVQVPLPTGGGSSGGSVSTIVGNAKAAQVTILGLLGTATTTALVDTGSLAGPMDARNASQLTGSVPGALSAETLQAATIGWPDQVTSQASLGSVELSVAGIAISASSLMSEATAVAGGAGSGASYISGLAINGVPVAVTGAPNQTVGIPGGRMILNEQPFSSGTTTVNAVHVIVNGVADVVLASSKAGIS